MAIENHRTARKIHLAYVQLRYLIAKNTIKMVLANMEDHQCLLHFRFVNVDLPCALDVVTSGADVYKPDGNM